MQVRTAAMTRDLDDEDGRSEAIPENGQKEKIETRLLVFKTIYLFYIS